MNYHMKKDLMENNSSNLIEINKLMNQDLRNNNNHNNLNNILNLIEVLMIQDLDKEH